MAKTRYAIILAVAVVATAGFLGTSAFTSASLDRSVSVDVVQDNNGPIALSPDADSEFVGYDSAGALAIQLDSDSTATGVNPEATYTIGDAANAASENAFTITNQASTEHTVDLTESISGVDFAVYTGDATNGFTKVGSTDAGDASATLASGSSAYVVMTIDTTGMSKGSTISGTLNVDA